MSDVEWKIVEVLGHVLIWSIPIVATVGLLVGGWNALKPLRDIEKLAKDSEEPPKVHKGRPKGLLFPGSIASRILEVLEEAGGSISVAALLIRLGPDVDPRSARTSLSRLYRTGKVLRVAEARYALPPKSKEKP